MNIIENIKENIQSLYNHFAATLTANRVSVLKSFGQFMVDHYSVPAKHVEGGRILVSQKEIVPAFIVNAIATGDGTALLVWLAEMAGGKLASPSRVFKWYLDLRRGFTSGKDEAKYVAEREASLTYNVIPLSDVLSYLAEFTVEETAEETAEETVEVS